MVTKSDMVNTIVTLEKDKYIFMKIETSIKQNKYKNPVHPNQEILSMNKNRIENQKRMPQSRTARNELES